MVSDSICIPVTFTFMQTLKALSWPVELAIATKPVRLDFTLKRKNHVTTFLLIDGIILFLLMMFRVYKICAFGVLGNRHGSTLTLNYSWMFTELNMTVS